METEIRTVLEAIRRGHHDKDAAAIATQYTPDAITFTLAPPLKNRGVDVAELQAWLDGWKGPVEQETRDLTITVRGDLAFAHALIHVRATTQDGQPAAWWMRATVCLRREDEGWRIAHEHTSVPFHMDGSFRAATDLEP